MAVTGAPPDAAWNAVAARAEAMQNRHLRDLFAQDARRFERFSVSCHGLLLDYSKQRIDAATMAALHGLWHAADVPRWIARMRDGEPINHTEGRAVLHFALRAGEGAAVCCAGRDVMPGVRAVREKMARFCAAVHDGHWRGATGLPIRSVVNIGIGGSDLGPRMAVQALSACRVPGLDVHFVANLDAADLATTLARLQPASTLFIIASKTFTTQETLQNARSARAWLTAALGEQAVSRHFVAVSSNLDAVAEFGIDPGHSFEFWDWVGGRFSLWSAIGLPLALAVGYENFARMLAGAVEMDEHFFSAPVASNLPALMALLEVWNTDFLGVQTRAVLPYSQSLELLPRYLQQLEMESNGKRTDREGRPPGIATAPVVWGEPGTNGQHAFYQLLHQGGRLIPCDFIALARPDHALAGHHDALLAHCFAQSEALMRGKTMAEARGELATAGLSAAEIERHAPYRVFPGNQPSSTLLLPRLDPCTLGQLIALHEHKVFTLGALWNINSFDQWGVEFGKQLARRLLPMVESGVPEGELDGSTAGLIRARRDMLSS